MIERVSFGRERVLGRGRVEQWLVVLDQIDEARMLRLTDRILGLLGSPPRRGHEQIACADCQRYGAVVHRHELDVLRQVGSEEAAHVLPEPRGVFIERELSAEQADADARHGQPSRDLERGVGPSRQVAHRQARYEDVQTGLVDQLRRHDQVERVEPRQAALRRDVSGAPSRSERSRAERFPLLGSFSRDMSIDQAALASQRIVAESGDALPHPSSHACDQSALVNRPLESP